VGGKYPLSISSHTAHEILRISQTDPQYP